MKFFSLKTVTDAYKANSSSTKNKFWGLLSILSSIDSTIEAGISYDFNTQKVSTLLEKLFCLEEEKKSYVGDSMWNIMLSKKWTEKVPEQMLTKTPNIYDVLVWYFRTQSFDDDIANTDLIKLFLESIHISVEDAQEIFDFGSTDIEYSDSLYSETDLHKSLGISGTCITAESASIVAHPGELSRAPFIQTLYAGQSTLECLIITPFKFSDYYSSTVTAITKQDTSIQKIYYGCPGTGKSHKVKKDTEGLEGEKAVYFDNDGNKIQTPEKKEDRVGKPSNIFRTTFHPDYDYAAFVGSYKPVMKAVLNEDGTETGKEELSYDFVPQVFTNAYIRAYRSLADGTLSEEEKQVYLIIEEINRGNCAQIFGDLFQLLDRKDGRSEYAIIPEAELGKYLKGLKYEGLKGDKLELPANLHILATMNTSDQSLFPMDSAFKRRWEMEYIPINLDDKTSDAKDYAFKVKNVEYSWIEFLKKVNPLIRKATDSEDKQMGEFFIKVKNKEKCLSEEEFKNKVMFYLWNDVCKDLYSASRISPDYFLRDDATEDNRKAVFTFAELYGDGRINTVDSTEDNTGDVTYTSPEDLLEGFITKKLGLKPKAAE